MLQGVGTGAAPAERRANIVFVHLVQDRRAKHLHRHGNAGQGNGQSREEHVQKELSGAVVEGHKVSRHEDPQGDAEEETEQDAHKDRGDGHADLVEHRDEFIQPAPLPLRRQDAQRERGGHGDAEGHEDQRRRSRQLFHHHVFHGHVIAVRRAPVPPDEVGDPAAIPNQNRVVQAQLQNSEMDISVSLPSRVNFSFPFSSSIVSSSLGKDSR